MPGKRNLFPQRLLHLPPFVEYAFETDKTDSLFFHYREGNPVPGLALSSLEEVRRQVMCPSEVQKSSQPPPSPGQAGVGWGSVTEHIYLKAKMTVAVPNDGEQLHELIELKASQSASAGLWPTGPGTKSLQQMTLTRLETPVSGQGTEGIPALVPKAGRHPRPRVANDHETGPMSVVQRRPKPGLGICAEIGKGALQSVY